ncbi:hypothetical protein [Streptomyces malaysiensis]|uniref:hypothetical protein n=1 Tax=Streptomyces malaysiensis TaxID=92644 RepID=UPI0033F67960
MKRQDAASVRWNETLSEESSISKPNYQHETALEPSACPACTSRDNFLAEGRWGDPLTLHCRCGVTIMSPLDAPPMTWAADCSCGSSGARRTPPTLPAA